MARLPRVDALVGVALPLELLAETGLYDFYIPGLVHMIDDLRPDRVIEERLSVLDIHAHSINVGQGFLWVLFSQVVLQELADGALDSQLDIAELLVDLMPEDFSE